MARVLVTGGTGFIARWCIVTLLQQGFDVRTTVRTPAREADVRAAIGEAVEPEERLAIVPADLTSDEGWDDAVVGCRYVLHPASPLGGAPGESILAAARDGARRRPELQGVLPGLGRAIVTAQPRPSSYSDGDLARAIRRCSTAPAASSTTA